MRTFQGLCGIVGISIGAKKSSRKCPLSASSQAKPSSCSIIKRCMSFLSSGHRKSSEWTPSIIRMRSSVYRPTGSKGAGRVGSCGSRSSGSPVMFLTMRYRSGSCVATGRTLRATGLYFFAAYEAKSLEFGNAEPIKEHTV